MKTKVLMLVLLMSMSAVLVAQPVDRGGKKSFRGSEGEMQMKEEHGGFAKGLNLTDAQKDVFKQNMLAMQKQLQPLRNELGEALAHQKTLMTAEKPDLNAVNKNIDKIGALKIEMAKLKAKNRLDMRAQLTDEQRLKFDNFKEKMMQKRGWKGMKHQMGKKDKCPMN